MVGASWHEMQPMRRLLQGRGCLFLGVYSPSKHYISACFCLIRVCKDDKYLLQELQLFTMGLVEESNTASLFPLQNQDCETIAAAKE